MQEYQTEPETADEVATTTVAEDEVQALADDNGAEDQAATIADAFEGIAE